MKILPLKKDDFDALALAKKSGYFDEWNDNMLLSAVDNGNFLGVKCEMDGKIVGYAHYSIAIDCVDINSVYVFKDYRNKGLAQELLKSIIKDAKSLGAKQFFLEVRKSNLPALSLYEKLGFKKVGERKKYYSDGENAIVMSKGE